MALTDELFFFQCDGCLGTYTGKPHELPKLGWKRHPYKRAGSRRPEEFLLCVDCERRYEPIWKAA